MRTAVALFVLGLMSCTAGAAIITFDANADVVDTPDPVLTTDSDGASWTFTAGGPNPSPDLDLGSGDVSSFPLTSGKALEAGNNGCSILFAPTDSSDFTITSMVLGNLTYGAKTYTITGTLSAGGTVDEVIPLGGRGEATVTFDASWTGLSQVHVDAAGATSGRAIIDNINVLIPEPTTMALLAAGSLALLRRRHAA